MTPEPKNLAKLYDHKLPWLWKKNLRTNSNTGLGTCSQLDRFARTGNKAPAIEPTSIMNTEPILRPKDESSPPPEPQATASDMARVWVEGLHSAGLYAGRLWGFSFERRSFKKEGQLANLDHVIRFRVPSQSSRSKKEKYVTQGDRLVITKKLAFKLSWFTSQ